MSLLGDHLVLSELCTTARRFVDASSSWAPHIIQRIAKVVEHLDYYSVWAARQVNCFRTFPLDERILVKDHYMLVRRVEIIVWGGRCAA